MKHLKILAVAAAAVLILCGCSGTQTQQVAATTLPVFELTQHLCTGTDISVAQLITENVSCLHDYTLQVSQMRTLEGAELIITSGAGLEDFMQDILDMDKPVVDASESIALLCPDNSHDHSDHTGHTHTYDPHIWLSPLNAKTMAVNICDGLKKQFPQYKTVFENNLETLLQELDALYQYGLDELRTVSCRELITFHDGFSYFAQCFDLSILHAVEEEAGSEASAAELIELTQLIQLHDLPAIFTETNGSASAATIVANEADIQIYTLDMAMSERGYFQAIRHNIHTVKEALG